LGVAGWRHVAGKVTAIGAVILAGLATFVVWEQFRHPTAELDGTWQTVRMEYEDGSTRNDMASVTRLTIVGEKLKCSFRHPAPRGDIDGFITIDATQSPKTFLAEGIRGAVSFYWSGIYEIEGDTLKPSFAADGKGARPKEFKSNPAVLLVLKRVK
jgi:uncharacterized protein (TIGR03067 family)